MSQIRKMYLIDESAYEKLKNLPPAIQLNQERTKFVRDRIKNQNENENIWSKLTERIQPLLNAHGIPPTQQQQQQQQQHQQQQQQQQQQLTPPSGAPASVARQGFDLVARNLDRELADLDEEELGAIGGEPRQQRRQSQQQQQQLDEDPEGLKERDRRLSVLGDVVNQAPKHCRSKFIALYKILVEQPGVRITPSKITVNGKRQKGSTVDVLSDLVKNKQTLRYKNPDLISVLSQISDILFTVINKEATWQILNAGQEQGLSMRTPVEKNKRNRKKKNQANEGERLTSSGLKRLQDFERSRGFDIDTTYLDESLNKRGKGKVSKNRRPSNFRFKWESLF